MSNDVVPGFLFIDHVAIAVPTGQLQAQIDAYQSLGFTEVHREEVLGGDQVREVLLRFGDGPNLVQLLEPLSVDSPVARQIQKNGGRGGFAHIAYRVSSALAAYQAMQASGFQLIDPAPRKGSRGTTVFFVHPKSLGMLIEIVEAPLEITTSAGKPVASGAPDQRP